MNKYQNILSSRIFQRPVVFTGFDRNSFALTIDSCSDNGEHRIGGDGWFTKSMEKQAERDDRAYNVATEFQT